MIDKGRCKGILASVTLCLTTVLLSGCDRIKPYNLVDTYVGIGNAYAAGDLTTMGLDNYDKFIHRRFILVYDEDGILNYIKVDNTVPRHNYDWSRLSKDDTFTYYTQEDGRVCNVGIDVSTYQGYINWPVVASQGIDFAFIRLGYRGYGTGKMVDDDNFRTNLVGASNAGISTGVYFYSQATNYNEGVEEANYVLERIAGYGVTYPIVFDTEDAMQDEGRTEGISVQDRTDAAKGFCETIANAGYRPMIYSNRNWLVMDLDISQLKEYDIWLAHYTDQPDFPYEFDIWQYSAEGKLDGISQPVDLNIGFTDYNGD